MAIKDIIDDNSMNHLLTLLEMYGSFCALFLDFKVAITLLYLVV